ncbi:hypothetical protein DFJ74DRAFT_673532 [Hyaloraphidium curvatum]|nr:hypothetical protein DFJ74DRAFT_673532 [Hyaloraphidium curvatum]
MSWSGFKKAINRGTTSIMQNFNMVEKTVDKEFEDEEKRFRNFESKVNRLAGEVKGTLDSTRAITLSQKSAAEAVEAFYDAQQELCHAAMEYRKRAEEVDEQLRSEFDESYRLTVLEPMQHLAAALPEVKLAMDKRAKKLLDYDAQRAKVRKLVEKPDSDASKLPRNEGKLHEYRQAYESLNQLLLNEIPRLIDARVPAMDPSVEALIKANLIFWRRALGRLEELESCRGLDERDPNFMGGPNGEGVVEQALEQMRGFTIVRGDLLKSSG